MKVVDLLKSLHVQGIILFLSGDSLKFRAPRNLTASERSAVAQEREAIIGLLKMEERWRNLLESGSDPEQAETDEDEIFLSASRILRSAATPEAWDVRWNGYGRFLREHLPPEAVTVLRETQP